MWGLAFIIAVARFVISDFDGSLEVVDVFFVIELVDFIVQKIVDTIRIVIDLLILDQQDQFSETEIDELKIAFAAFADNQNVAQFEEMYLKKGRSYSYFVLPAAAGTRLKRS